jgi:hypothetical protein
MLVGPGWRQRLLILLAVSVALVTGAAAAEQENFRITYKEDAKKEDPAHYLLVGYVANDARRDALNVYMTVEALDAHGKVVASGVTYVAPVIPRSGNAPFAAKVPRVAGVESFRLMVTGFKFGLGVQGR